MACMSRSISRAIAIAIASRAAIARSFAATYSAPPLRCRRTGRLEIDLAADGRNVPPRIFRAPVEAVLSEQHGQLNEEDLWSHYVEEVRTGKDVQRMDFN